MQGRRQPRTDAGRTDATAPRVHPNLEAQTVVSQFAGTDFANSAHGADTLDLVEIDSYNVELRDEDGFLGDRASKTAFRAILERWRGQMSSNGPDPLGAVPTSALKTKALDRLIVSDQAEVAGLLHSAIEEFAQELTTVIRRFLRAKGWQDTERIAIGGGLRASRVGEIAVGRAAVLLRAEGRPVTLRPIRHHPDEAGLIGAVHLAPSWVFAGHDCILAADIGGTNMRAGVVELKLKKAPDLSAAHVMGFDRWRHRDDGPKRDEAVDRLAGMLRKLIRRAERDGRRLAPFIGVGCPGRVGDDASIEAGAQNLPGNWESSRFNLAGAIRERIPRIGGQSTMVVVHNDAVVQGLSEVPWMQDVRHWAVLTMGTGLGNVRFSNRGAEASVAA